MCILISSIEHPDYPFILLSNRDEYFKRPTERAHFKDYDGVKILSPLDLGRPEHGTWIAVNTDGKLAVLVNYREINNRDLIGEISRGILPLQYLISNDLNEDWHIRLNRIISQKLSLENHLSLNDNILSRIGGFSILYGQLKINETTGNIEPLNILSNRGDHGKVYETNGETTISDDIGTQTTFGLSNSLYDDPWRKVNLGQKMLGETIKESVENNYTQDQLIESCFEVLSYDTYDKNIANNGTPKEATRELRNSIYIPPIELKTVNQYPGSPTVGRFYGTRTQTIILLDKKGNVHYYERDIHNSDLIDDEIKIKTNHFQFNISNK